MHTLKRQRCRAPRTRPPIAITPSDGFSLEVVDQTTPHYVIVKLTSPAHNWLAGTFTHLPTDKDVTIGLSIAGNDTKSNAADVKKWQGLVPVMTYADPKQYETYKWDAQGRWVSGDPFKQDEAKYAGTGKVPAQAVIPKDMAEQFLSADGKYWSAWREVDTAEALPGINVFRITQRFGQATATVAMRVPYTYTRGAPWASATKTPSASTAWNLATTTVPSPVYIEGTGASSAVGDLEVILRYANGGTTTQDVVKATVVDVNLEIEGVADADEETVGGVVGKGAGLLPITLSIPESLRTGVVSLEATAGGTRIELYEDAEGTTALPLVPVPTWNLANQEAVSQTLYINGVQASAAMRDATLKLRYEKAGQAAEDFVKLTVAKIDLVIQNLAEEIDAGGNPPHETDPDAFLPANTDDDNGNGIADHAEVAVWDEDLQVDRTYVESENDLVALKIGTLPVGSTGTVTLASSNDKLVFWTSPKKDSKVSDTLTRTWTIGDENDPIPDTVYVEGVAVSTAVRDTEITLTYTGAGITVADVLKVTVVQADVSIQECTEASEVSPGAIVMLNREGDDLVPMTLTLSPSGVDVGKLGLTMSGGVKLWTSLAKEVEAPASWTLAPGAPFTGATYYVEGTAVSTALRDKAVSFTYAVNEKKVHEDIGKVTVANLTISLPEKALYTNTDDDNLNGTDDINDPGEVADENDLKQLLIKLEPAGLTGTLTVAVKTLETENNAGEDYDAAPRVNLTTLPKVGQRLSETHTWQRPNDTFPTALWVEGKRVSADEDDQEITVTYEYGASSLSSIALATVEARIATSEVCFRLYQMNDSNPTVASLATQPEINAGTVGDTVAVVMEVKIGPDNRVARDAEGTLLANEVQVLIKDLWEGYEPDKSRAQCDPTVALDWASRLSECQNVGTPQASWNAGGDTAPSESNLNAAKPRIFRAIVKKWDTRTGPGVTYFNEATQQWTGFTPTMGHNTKHSISVMAIDGDATKTKIPFQQYTVATDGWGTATEVDVKAREVEVKNLVVSNVNATTGTVDYLRYDPDPDSPYHRPRITFSVDDTVFPQPDHTYKYWVMIQPTKDSGKELLDLDDIYSYAYTFAHGQMPPVVSEIEWVGTDSMDGEPDSAQRGTYTYDVVVEEWVGSTLIDRFAYKWPYCLTVDKHDTWVDTLDSGQVMKFHYTLYDYCYYDTTLPNSKLHSPTGVNVIIIDNELNERQLTNLIANPNEIGNPHDGGGDGLVAYEASDSEVIGTWRILITGRDECWVAYRRDHNPSLMLAVNKESLLQAIVLHPIQILTSFLNFDTGGPDWIRNLEGNAMGLVNFTAGTLDVALTNGPVSNANILVVYCRNQAMKDAVVSGFGTIRKHGMKMYVSQEINKFTQTLQQYKVWEIEDPYVFGKRFMEAGLTIYSLGRGAQGLAKASLPPRAAVQGAPKIVELKSGSPSAATISVEVTNQFLAARETAALMRLPSYYIRLYQAWTSPKGLVYTKALIRRGNSTLIECRVKHVSVDHSHEYGLPGKTYFKCPQKEILSVVDRAWERIVMKDPAVKKAVEGGRIKYEMKLGSGTDHIGTGGEQWIQIIVEGEYENLLVSAYPIPVPSIP